MYRHVQGLAAPFQLPSLVILSFAHNRAPTAMDTNNNSEETQQLKASLETLRAELSYAKNHNSDWFEAFLNRIDHTNTRLANLQRSVTMFGWVFLLITVALLATLILNNVIILPTWESVYAFWNSDLPSI